MNASNFSCAVACIVICFAFSGFSLSSFRGKDSGEFSPQKCSTDDQCSHVCFEGENLYSRCDPNGTCICDCSDTGEITSTYASACEIKQPDGHWRDYCDAYCTQEYLRPCRYCNDSNGFIYCTCVCTKNRAYDNRIPH